MLLLLLALVPASRPAHPVQGLLLLLLLTLLLTSWGHCSAHCLTRAPQLLQLHPGHPANLPDHPLLLLPPPLVLLPPTLRLLLLRRLLMLRVWRRRCW